MTQLLQNAAYGTALILAVALLRRVLKDRLIPEARLALWAVCLFRLLTPAAPESVLSLWGLFAKPAPVQTPQLYIPAPSLSAPAPQPAAPAFSWEMALAAAWLAVGGVLAVRYALSWGRTRRAVACAIPLGRDDPRYAPLPKCARLREGVMEGAPLTFGVARPTVVLSPGLDGEELVCVLAHEGVHAARRDNLWHYVMAQALAVHWWNPAVWLMSCLLRRDIELACDRAALKKLGPDKRAQYAQALVTLATQDTGPAFCQTFGRKAAEERILSVMKFKKTSIIGVIFSLALVLAVTAAFASEPKTDETVQFHGQTFQRDQLSQGTLDWLDWYFTLTEEEQLAISYVPAELGDGKNVSTQDAYSSEKSASEMTPLPDKTKEIQSAFPEIDPDDVDLSEMKKMLDKKVADGQLTQAEADQRLADTEEMLAKARRGELKLFWYDDGAGESWCYGIGVFQVNGEMQSRFVDPGQMLQPLYYEDENGKLVPVDPDTVINGYVLNPSYPDLPTYVEAGEDLIDTTGRLLGEADIKYDEDMTPQDYDVKLPTFDEDGNSVSADGGIVGSRFYDYIIETDPNVAEFDIIGQQQMELEEYKSLLNKLAADGEMTQAEADGMYASAKQDLKSAGEMSGLYANETGGYAIMTLPLCSLPECKDYEPHKHGVAKYSGHVTFPCPVENCQNGGSHYHDGVCYLGTLPICDFSGCTISGIHTHDDGVTYKGQTGKQPAPVPSAVPVSSGQHHQNHNGNGHH